MINFQKIEASYNLQMSKNKNSGNQVFKAFSMSDLIKMQPKLIGMKNQKQQEQASRTIKNSNSLAQQYQSELFGNHVSQQQSTEILSTHQQPSSNLNLLPTEQQSRKIPAVSSSSNQKLQVTLDKTYIDFTLTSAFQQIKLINNVTIPNLCSITGLRQTRASVDIICLIDQSSSMSGLKIQLVRDAMKYFLKMLTPKDRLSIAVYENEGTRLCPFRFVNEDNMGSLEGIVNQLRAGGGNIMLNGLQVAVKILRERRNRNQVTSIFLLSDGHVQRNTGLKFKQMLEKEQNKKIGFFSLYLFVFGNNHGQNVITKVFSLNDGNFYNIKPNTLDKALTNVLNVIVTQTATEIEINVECIAPAPFEGITIQEVYGNKWKKINDKKYSISINQIMSSVSKNIVFQLHIPMTDLKTSDTNRSFQVLQATYTAKDIITGAKLQGSAKLKLKFLDRNSNFNCHANPTVLKAYQKVFKMRPQNDKGYHSEKKDKNINEKNHALSEEKIYKNKMITGAKSYPNEQKQSEYPIKQKETNKKCIIQSKQVWNDRCKFRNISINNKPSISNKPDTFLPISSLSSSKVSANNRSLTLNFKRNLISVFQLTLANGSHITISNFDQQTCDFNFLNLLEQNERKRSHPQPIQDKEVNQSTWTVQKHNAAFK